MSVITPVVVGDDYVNSVRDLLRAVRDFLDRCPKCLGSGRTARGFPPHVSEPCSLCADIRLAFDRLEMWEVAK